MDHATALGRAVTLAIGRRTHPNPSVGCVVLDADGSVAGEGWHTGPGADHAEVVALAEAGARARGGTAVVTLEPCSHHGRTPPCTDALLRAGVRRVVFGAADPDGRVEGAAALTAGGVEVIGPVDAASCEEVDPAYFHHRRTGLPRVTLKAAATLDGATAAVDGTSQWITGTAAREDAHRLRAAHDAVLVGAGTVRADDPRLDVRIAGYEGPQPRPVVVGGTRPLPPDARIADRHPLVVATHADHPWGEVAVVRAVDGLPDPEEVLRAVADGGYLSVLLEGGATLAGRMWRDGLVAELVLYLGSLVAGGRGMPVLDGIFATLGDATPVDVREAAMIGENVRITCVRK